MVNGKLKIYNYLIGGILEMLLKVKKSVKYRIRKSLYKFTKSFVKFYGKLTYSFPNLAYWKFYHRLLFWLNVGYWPDLDNPRSFNEKIVWLKLNWRDPRLPILSDKILAKKYVLCKTDKIKVPNVLFITKNPDNIPFDSLPNRCVIKPNHASGKIIFFDSSISNINEIKNMCKDWISKPYGLEKGEWAYQSIERKIFGEELLLDESGNIPIDYKIYVFNGKAKYIFVVYDRFIDPKICLYDINWNLLKVERSYQMGKYTLPPKSLEDMIKIAEELSDNLVFVRVDMYVVNEEIYFGEFAFYPGSGLKPFIPVEFDFMLGNELNITLIK